MEDTVEAPASSSPTTSTPTSDTPQSTTDRPSFGEALKTFNEAAVITGRRQRGQAPAPSSPAPTSPPEGATRPPEVPADASAQPPAKSGFISTVDHLKANENIKTRTAAETRQAVEQEYRQKYAPIEALSQEYHTNRQGFIARIVNEALRDPDLAPQIRSLAGQTLRGGQAAPASHEAPPPDFQDGQGNQFYSAKAQQARDQWLIQQVRDQVLGEVEPALQTTAELKAEREAEQANTQLKQVMSSHLSDARTWPHFTEHEAEIKQFLATAPLTSGHPAEEALLLRKAYDRIVGPKLSALEQKRIVADLQSRAHASTLNPASTGAPSGIPKNVTAKHGGTMKEALAWAAREAAGR